mmetsp:Transcript_2415/g.10372  ORF Transcript_2415/g.10372 Transcript_2415/m.10372 type:complete len:205 (-) Transcript_2415:371-985(-)
MRRPRRAPRRRHRGEGGTRLGGGGAGGARAGVPREDAPRPARPRRRRVRRPGRAAPPRALRVVLPSRRGADPRVFPVRRSRQTRVARRGRLRQVDVVDGGQDDERRAAVLVRDSRRGRRRRGGRARRQVAVRFDLERRRRVVRESRGSGVPNRRHDRRPLPVRGGTGRRGGLDSERLDGPAFRAEAAGERRVQGAHPGAVPKPA